MLLVPYVVAAAAFPGWLSFNTLAGLGGVLLLFFARPPLMLLLKRRVIDGSFGTRSGSLWLDFALTAGLSLAVFIFLTAGRGLWGVACLAAVSIVLFGLHTRFTLSRQERSALNEFIGIIMLTATAPLAAYLSLGELRRMDVWMLWLLNALYFGASVYFIKMFMRAAAYREQRLTLGIRFFLARSSLAYLVFAAALLAAVSRAGWVPAYTFLAFAPVFIHVVRNVFTLKPGMNLKVEGFIQAGLSIIFAASLIAVYRLA